jgi:hypothetical protein
MTPTREQIATALLQSTTTVTYRVDASPDAAWFYRQADAVLALFETSPGEGTAAASPSDGGDLRSDAPSPGEDKHNRKDER